MALLAWQEEAIRRAAGAGLAFALWRAPGESAFGGAVSLRGSLVRDVFAPDPAPGFVLCPFETSDASRAEFIPADLLLTGDAPSWADGSGRAAHPVTAAQAAFLRRAAPRPLPLPVPLPGAADDPAGVPRARYEAQVAAALQEIAAGRCRKIVLSRPERRALPPGFDALAAVQALARLHPQAFVALVQTPAAGCWLVATPETLLSADGQALRTMALAGTQWPPPEVPPEALDWSPKIVEEQALVAGYLRAVFAAAGIRDLAETPARGVRAGNLCHLRSDFTARRGGADADALARLLRALHPTPAVCGLPKEAALEWLRTHECRPRGHYTGYLGPVDIAGRTSLFVNLRSARLTASGAVLHVGGGIVAGSEPAVEWQETVEKARTIGEALGPVPPA